jgi:probable rRNA maturation factor
MDFDPLSEDDTPYQIHVTGSDECAQGEPARSVDVQRIIDALVRVFQREGHDSGALSVALVNDATMTDLHQRYMGIAETTDVLTFDLSEPGSAAVDGEIIICADVAARESASRSHAFADEVLLYAVHGCLHLLGYDDMTDDAAARMHAREDELLTTLGIGPVYRRAAS